MGGELSASEFSYRAGLLLGAGLFLGESIGPPWGRGILAFAAALVALLVHAKLLVEPSGAAALAAALRGGIPGAPRRVGVILSGGNVEPALVAELLAAAEPR